MVKVRNCYDSINKPATQAVDNPASNPAKRALRPMAETSLALLGAIAETPPMRIPRLPKLAKEHRANVNIIVERG